MYCLISKVGRSHEVIHSAIYDVYPGSLQLSSSIAACNYLYLCVCTMYEIRFVLHNSNLCSSGRGSFLDLSAAGHAGAPSCTPRRMGGPRPGSVARALGIQSRAGWQVIARSRSASPKLTRILESHIFKFFCRSLLRCCVSMSHRLSSSFVGGHHSTTEAALLALPFVAATDGASLSSCVCAEFPSSYHRT